MKTFELITGRTINHLLPFEGTSFFVHKDMHSDLAKLFKIFCQKGDRTSYNLQL
jgi:hypothetical protein